MRNDFYFLGKEEKNLKNLTSNQIRQMWLDFFKSKNHEIINSASLIPQNDPSLLWINAGVAPLKKYFDGRETPKNKRMCNAQKCIRTNDIDNVGKTARHHTFFEMLGNFSIGDYFRDEVLSWAYELLFSNEWFAFDPDNIYITYYPEDVETYNKWLSLGIKENHLVSIKDNFWEIGEGPCGPDTEIFYDRGIKYDPNNLGIKLLTDDIENDRYIEIWNIVFSQFNSTPGVKRENYPELPSKNIDTGSGLERLTCIFQNTETNYETDLFLPLIKFLEKNTNHSYYDPKYQMAFRVIADHIRSVTFAIADGAMLSNEGRGYVLRRLLRRAVRYARNLGIDRPFLYQLVGIVVDNMKDYYGYLQDKQPIVEKMIRIEEENFLKTLSRGELLLSDIMKELGNNKVISGAVAFQLYDTFGFPIELTVEIASQNGYQVELEAFKLELEKQRLRARTANGDNDSMGSQNAELLNFKENSEFVGYDTLTSKSKIIAIFKDGQMKDYSSGLLQIVLDKTPFYAEMGGQIGDIGTISVRKMEFNVLDTVKLPNGQHSHIIDTKDVVLYNNEEIEASVNLEYRHNVSINHSATHLLNEALRSVLGSHVVQQGSQVTNNSLRFDFNHYENIQVAQLLAIEKLVQEQINADYQVKTILTTPEEAKKMGAQAVFGEKYGDVVRLVDMNFSKELCGGTHVKHLNEIKNFAITSIESKGSGIFRIEAVAGNNVLTKVTDNLSNIKENINKLLNKIDETYQKAKANNYPIEPVTFTAPKIIGSYQDVINYRKFDEEVRAYQKDLDKKYDALKRNNLSSNYRDFEQKMLETINGHVLVDVVENIDINALKEIVDKIANDYEKCVIFFANIINNEKIIFIAKAKNSPVNCGMLVKKAALITGGNGGGRPDFAQSGGKDISKINDVVEEILGSLK